MDDAELGEQLGVQCVSKEVHSLGAVVGEGRECFVNLEVRVREKDRCLMEGLKVILERFGGISGEWGSMGWKTGWWSSIWESRWGCVGKEGWAVE